VKKLKKQSDEFYHLISMEDKSHALIEGRQQTQIDKDKADRNICNRSKPMRTIGILGGLGPHTSSIFYLNIIDRFSATGSSFRPPVLMWSVPLDLEVERKFIKTGEGKDEYLRYLIQGAENLQKGGADFIVIPCNTVHIHIDNLRKKIGIPILSIVEETVKYLKANGVSKVAILATNATIEENLYGLALEKEKILPIIPDKNAQKTVMEVISNILANSNTNKDMEKLSTVIRKLKCSGINDMLLACTDLQILMKQNECSAKVHDTMDILAGAAVRECSFLT